jgi:hypothetical protein
MMRFTVDGVKYEMDQKRLRNTEAIALQKVTGMTVVQFYDALSESDATAVTALVWLVKQRAGEQVRFSDLDFDLLEVMTSLESDPEDEEAEGEPDPTAPLDEPSSSGEPAT